MARGPWHSASELAMVRSFFYPDRSPLEGPIERPTTPYKDSRGNLVNTFIAPSFTELDAAFQARTALSEGDEHDASYFSYTQSPVGTVPGASSLKQQHHIPKNPKNCRMRAIEIVQRVTAKYGPAGLPHPVIATCQLTAAILYEEAASKRFYDDTYDYITQLSVEATLASALSKFVTGLVDRDIKLGMQEKKAEKKMASKKRKAEDTENNARPEETTGEKVSNSMLSNATQIGLPTSFVELRHQITHDQMPNIPQMKLMAVRALDWLWSRYWISLDLGGDEWGLEERERLKWRKEQNDKAREAPQHDFSEHNRESTIPTPS